MVQRNRHFGKRPKPRGPVHPATPQSTTQRTAPVIAERKAPVVYGKPFIVLEDAQKVAFIYRAGQWVADTKSIAEYRQDCQVKQLAQKINGMTRYEVCAPVSTTA